jgi:soluble lytic murein transglycosylase-like protein
MTAIVLVLAADLVHLTSGYTLPADRVELRNGEVILHRAGGETALPVSSIAVIEPQPEPRAPTAVEDSIPAPPSPKSPQDLVREAASRHGLPPEFVASVARAESAFNPRAVSHKGAIGLMQLMPATAAALGADPQDPAQNADAGARLLRDLLIRYQEHPDQVRRALAAYNAGEGAVKKYNGVPPYAETLTYVERVLKHYRSSTR